MKALVALVMALLATTLLSGCGDGPCAAGFSFKYCLDQKATVPTYTLGGSVTGLGAAQSVTLVLNKPAVSFTAPTTDPSSFPGSGAVGWSFTVDENKNVSYLGLYNTELNGDTTVGVWNSSGQLVTSKVFTVSGISTAELDASGFFWLPITQALAPGQYTMGAFSTADHLGVYGAAPITTYGLKLNTMSVYGSDAVLAKPTDSISDVYPNGFFGPNLRFSSQKIISTNGAFAFDAPSLNAELYSVTISTQPSGATCVLTNGSGKVTAANVTNIAVTCTQN